MSELTNTSLFYTPSKEFRGLPFWAWNTEITSQKITKQVEVFKQMGFGGFVIHVRHGLRDEYMGQNFFERITQAIEEAKKHDLTVWLYDEDRWPSGCAGGLVTKEKRYRQKTLLFTSERRNDCVEREEGIKYGKPWLVAAYNILLNDEHELISCEVVDEANANYFAYVITADGSPRYNGQAYVDVLDEEAIQKFIETTYEVYFQKYEKEFGKQLEAIFTDEPQVAILPTPLFSNPDKFTEVSFPWTNNLPQTYEKTFGENIVPSIPELIWNRADGKLSLTRYRFNEHIAERFRNSYSKQIGKWCAEHNIALTGHFMLEGSLFEQQKATRDVMRCYPDLQLPGIDNLCGRYEFNTAKQCQSVARQKGISKVISELYGVTNWTADFRDYIHQGNWQAALGVTVRVPHLSWMTMKGVGKRDYPATFGYQSPWYKEFHHVEDHFARINTVLTSGTPVVRVGVIHPVESYWFYFGANDKNSDASHARDKAFADLCEWLIFNGTDFDYISEALIPEMYNDTRIGEMTYDVILIPDCITLRKTTLDMLKNMQENGIEIIFAGNIPTHIDGIENASVKNFAEDCLQIPFDKQSILAAMSKYKAFKLTTPTGAYVSNYIHQERIIDGKRWFYISPATPVTDKENTELSNITLKIRGEYIPTLFDTLSGKTVATKYCHIDKYTLIELKKYSYSSFLLTLEKNDRNNTLQSNCAEPSYKTGKEITIPHNISYIREEDNVCLLDIADYSFDGDNFEGYDEIFHIDTFARKKFDLPSIIGKFSFQPWCIKHDVEYPIWLRYTFDSEIEKVCKLAYEKIDTLIFNGKKIDIIPDGSYVDDDILTITLPTVKTGHNEIIISTTVSSTSGIEPMYLIGDFNVELTGIKKTLKKASKHISFGNSTTQGLPFYGGNLIYTADINTPDCDLEITVAEYRGDLVTVSLDGEEKGAIILPPYRLIIKNVGAGTHIISIKCFGNRNNTFGSLHSAVKDTNYAPYHWYRYGDDFSYEYDLCSNGILSTPIITILE